MKSNSETNQILSNIATDIKNGKYDDQLNVPLATRDKLFSFITEKIHQKNQKGQNPNLTSYEINDCITQTLEHAVTSLKLFIEIGLMEEIDGEISLSNKGKKVLSPFSNII